MADVAVSHVKFPDIVVSSHSPTKKGGRLSDSAPAISQLSEGTPRRASLGSDASLLTKHVFVSSSKKVNKRSSTAPAAVDNPFKLPTQADMAAYEQNRIDERNKLRSSSLPLSERMTDAYLRGSTRMKFRELEVALDALPEEEESEDSIAAAMRKKNRDRDPIPSVLAKKREMFMLEFSLNVKRDEIQKLELAADQREDALRKAEKMLEEDAAKFDAILKDNNAKTLEATRKADQEAKLKIEKIQEIKRLNNEIASFRNEIAKVDEQLDECKRYKEFLVQLTPQEVLDAAKAKKEEGRLTQEEEELPMPFSEPQQLLDIFKQLEEHNMFLIQHSQESERVLEDLRVKRKETERRMEFEIAGLRGQIEILKEAIEREEDKANGLAGLSKTDLGANGQELTLENIQQAVELVYDTNIEPTDGNLGTLLMLTRIEKMMMDTFEKLETMPKDQVLSLEKMKDKERRARQRAEKLEIARQAQELRIQRQLERSLAPTKKRVGKPVMFRSVLVTKKKEVTTDHKSAAEEEERRIFFEPDD
eukprot:TRINITY_DN7445_c1_g2_i1.p1 TRINITY_DN7445_c1_g2~~TRINITY_DN7445_c1_g2_i1.p1  ORF type:complete len:534 (-),score=237.21 TRINITY_DN7445_c1_g2_i1:405-2006(-)